MRAIVNIFSIPHAPSLNPYSLINRLFTMTNDTLLTTDKLKALTALTPPLRSSASSPISTAFPRFDARATARASAHGDVWTPKSNDRTRRRTAAMLISQFFILGPRGDALAHRDFRGDVPSTSREDFYRSTRFWSSNERSSVRSNRTTKTNASPPPAFERDGVNYLHVKASGLYFVATTTSNGSPSAVLELLGRLARLVKDYCGALTEDAVRKNSTLVSEVIDEAMDYGYAQTTSTEMLRERVCSEPVETGDDLAGVLVSAKADGARAVAQGAFKAGQKVEAVLKHNLGVKVNFPTKAAINLMNAASVASGVNRVSSSATQKSVVSASSATTRDEIFVDIIEKVNVTFSANGDVVTSEINGHIQVRNFLQGAGTKVKMALSEDLTIGGKGTSARGNYAGVILDDCNFHESAKLEQFDVDRTITLRPPQGEFSLMNYRSAGNFKPPFKVIAIFDESVPYKVGVELKLFADFPSKHTCTGLIVNLPIPKGALGATGRLPKSVPSGSQHVMFDAAEKQIVWQFKKFAGGSDHECSVQIALQSERIPNVRREIGPLSLSFQIPTFCASALAVRYLQVVGNRPLDPLDDEAPPRAPHRWIRYLTKSSSYVVRV